jgi:hypothetical protein
LVENSALKMVPGLVAQKAAWMALNLEDLLVDQRVDLKVAMMVKLMVKLMAAAMAGKLGH